MIKKILGIIIILLLVVIGVGLVVSFLTAGGSGLDVADNTTVDGQISQYEAELKASEVIPGHAEVKGASLSNDGWDSEPIWVVSVSDKYFGISLGTVGVNANTTEIMWNGVI